MAIQALPTTRHTVPEVIPTEVQAEDHTVVVHLLVQVAVAADLWIAQIPVPEVEDNV